MPLALWIGLAALTATVLVAAGAPPASAGVLDDVQGCSGQTFEQPFVPWLDPAHYVLAPDGGLEEGGAGWTLAGGARVVRGNEAFDVRAATDAYSLFLPSGSSATTRGMCVGALHPTLRLFALNTGSLLSTLEVSVVFRDVLGAVRVAPVGLLVGMWQWQPTLPAPILANLTALPLVTDGTTAVAFRFTPRGFGSSWRIDDVYVDPYKGS